MSINTKYKKLKRDPKAFFRDSKFAKFISKLHLNQPDTQQNLIESDVKKKNAVKKSSKEVGKPHQKIEPSVIAKVGYKDEKLVIEYYDRKVNHSSLGYATLCIAENKNDYLINYRFFHKILKDKNFIAFREKSVYFVLEEKKSFDIPLKHKSNFFTLFAKNKELRSNLFKDFRNIVAFNPTSESFALMRQSSPFLVTICIVDSKKSLEFLKNYSEYIDILITYEHFDISAFGDVPRILTRKMQNVSFKTTCEPLRLYHYRDSYKSVIDKLDDDLFEMLKLALTDSSYKKDCNLLLPVFCSSDNLHNIDQFNDDHTIQGLIKYNLDVLDSPKTFNDIIENMEIQELYLRDNLYCLYKDLILTSQKNGNYSLLLKKTLSDGVYYEKI